MGFRDPTRKNSSPLPILAKKCLEKYPSLRLKKKSESLSLRGKFIPDTMKRWSRTDSLRANPIPMVKIYEAHGCFHRKWKSKVLHIHGPFDVALPVNTRPSFQTPRT